MVVVFGVATKIILILIVKGGVTLRFLGRTHALVGMLNITMSVRIRRRHKFLTIVVTPQQTTATNTPLLLKVSLQP